MNRILTYLFKQLFGLSAPNIRVELQKKFPDLTFVATEDLVKAPEFLLFTKKILQLRNLKLEIKSRDYIMNHRKYAGKMMGEVRGLAEAVLYEFLEKITTSPATLVVKRQQKIES